MDSGKWNDVKSRCEMINGVVVGWDGRPIVRSDGRSYMDAGASRVRNSFSSAMWHHPLIPAGFDHLASPDGGLLPPSGTLYHRASLA